MKKLILIIIIISLAGIAIVFAENDFSNTEERTEQDIKVYIDIALAEIERIYDGVEPSQRGVSIEGRVPNVTIQDGVVTVTFPPPRPNMRAGDFIFQIDEASGKVLDVKFWR